MAKYHKYVFDEQGKRLVGAFGRRNRRVEICNGLGMVSHLWSLVSSLWGDPHLASPCKGEEKCAVRVAVSCPQARSAPPPQGLDLFLSLQGRLLDLFLPLQGEVRRGYSCAAPCGKTLRGSSPFEG